MPRLISLLPLALLLAGCNSTDYVVQTVEGDRVVFTDHPFFQVLPLLIALPLVLLSLPFLTGRWKPKGKPRVLGVFLMLFGLLLVGAGLLIAPYTYTSVTRERLETRGGLLGQGTAATIDLSEVAQIEITESRRRGRGGKSRRRRKTIDVTFRSADGETEQLLMTGGPRRKALDYIVEKAPEWGLTIVDHRGE